MTEIQELFADIRNKIQPCRTVLETVSKKIPPLHLIEIALRNIEEIEKSLNKYEDAQGKILSENKNLKRKAKG